MGGPYALACAALLADRVDAAAVVAGGVPLDWPCAGGTFANRTDAGLLKLATHRPGAARTLVAASKGMVEHSPRLWWDVARRTMTSTDIASIERDGIEAFTRAIAGGLRDPHGAVDEYLAYVRPWGFAYEDVAQPVALWQGTDDEMVPPSWSEEAAQRLPHGTLHLVPGYGHFVALDHWAEILAVLA